MRLFLPSILRGRRYCRVLSHVNDLARTLERIAAPSVSSSAGQYRPPNTAPPAIRRPTPNLPVRTNQSNVRHRSSPSE
eukprot:640007-Prorocentrum_minimum.AAC.1